MRQENGNNYLKDKIEELKSILAYKLNGSNSCIADSLIDGLIDKVIVDNNKFIVKINSSVRKDIKKNSII